MPPASPTRLTGRRPGRIFAMTTAGGRGASARAGGISSRLVLVMAVATGLSVANNYFAQPLLPVIKSDLGMSESVAGLVVTIAQVGYAAGLVFLLPLGDLLERRRLVTVM